MNLFYINNNKILNKETNQINTPKSKNLKGDFQKKLNNNCIKKTYNSYNNIHFYNDNKVNKIISTNKKSENIKKYKNINIINKSNNFINKYNDKQKDKKSITKNLIIINNYHINDKSIRLIKNTTINNLINNQNKDIKVIKSKIRYINKNHSKIIRTKNFNLDKSINKNIFKLNNNKINKKSRKNIRLYLNTLNNSYELNNSKVINNFNNKSLNSNNL